MPKANLTKAFIEALKPGPKVVDYRDAGGSQSVPGLFVRISPGGHSGKSGRGGSRVFYLDIKMGDKRHTAKLGTTDELPLSKAREIARTTLAQARAAEAGHAQVPALIRKEKPKRIPSIGEWIETTYAPRVLAHKKSGEATRKRIKAAFAGKIWEMSMDSPKLAHAVLEWRQDRLDAGKMPSTINRDCAALKAAISHAVEMEVLDVHPLRRIRPLKEAQESRVRFLSDREEAALFAALDAREERVRAERDSANEWRRERSYAERIDLRTTPYVDFVKPAIILLLNTGMRRGECFALRWLDVDLDNRFLTVKASGTKSGKARRIPLNDTCMEMLTAWGSMTNRDGIVFPSPRGGGIINDFKKTWAGLMETAGIPDFRVHDMRHTFASRLVQLGVPLNTVRELLGHASLTMTMRYAHLAPEHGLEAVLRLDAPKGSIVPFPAGKPGK